MPTLRRLIPYLRPYRRHIAISLFCMVVSGALGGAFLFLAKKVLEPMLGSAMPDNVRMGRLNYFAMVVAAVAFVRAVTDFGQVYVTQRTGQRVLTKIRGDLFAHYQSLSVGFFEKQRTGDVMSRMFNDLGSLQNLMTMAVVTSISAPIEVFGAILYMIYTNWRLSVFVVVILPPVALLISRGGRKMRGASTRLLEQYSHVSEHLQEKISAMRLIQTFGTQKYEIQLFDKINQEAYRRTMVPIRLQAGLAPLIEFTGMVGVLLSLWFGGRDVIAHRMEAAALPIFLLAIHRVGMQAKAIAGLNLLFKQAEGAATRIFEVLDSPPDIKDAPNAIDLLQRKIEGHVVFEEVRFKYQEGPEVLHSVSFEIKPGEVVALAGLSGSGKSTIAALVPRLYDPTAGRVLVDGLDLRDVSLQSLRAHIGAVPQETTLFHGTIRDNIAYGRPEATLQEIVEAARQANADDFVRDQQDGYETQVGERGSRLSGGQRQRIAIARALLRDPRILILDEATSALDAESETLVQDALARLMKGRTTLIIAHRFSTILAADRIIVLDGGNIVETGTHPQLLERRGLYYRLFQMQSFVKRRDNLEAPEAPDSVAGLKVLPAAV